MVQRVSFRVRLYGGTRSLDFHIYLPLDSKLITGAVMKSLIERKEHLGEKTVLGLWTEDGVEVADDELLVDMFPDGATLEMTINERGHLEETAIPSYTSIFSTVKRAAKSVMRVSDMETEIDRLTTQLERVEVEQLMTKEENARLYTDLADYRKRLNQFNAGRKRREEMLDGIQKEPEQSENTVEEKSTKMTKELEGAVKRGQVEVGQMRISHKEKKKQWLVEMEEAKKETEKAKEKLRKMAEMYAWGAEMDKKIHEKKVKSLVAELRSVTLELKVYKSTDEALERQADLSSDTDKRKKETTMLQEHKKQAKVKKWKTLEAWMGQGSA